MAVCRDSGESSQPTVRPVSLVDGYVLWQWRNDPDARRWSVTNEPVPLHSHALWFFRRLASPKCVLLIASQARGNRLGVVRYDELASGIWVTSVIVAPRFRGLGVGKSMLRLSEAQLRRRRRVRELRARVHQLNEASLRLFESAGYVRSSLGQGDFLELAKRA